MKCPNCNKNMTNNLTKDQKNKKKKDKNLESLICKKCDITVLKESVVLRQQWEVPIFLRPTDKQERTLMFINRRLGLNLIPITKKQCIKDIGEFFELAKKKDLELKTKGV